MSKNKEAIEQIREILLTHPDHPNLIPMLTKIEQLQGKGKKRINDLRLAINYSRNSHPYYLTTWDCMLCHKEISSIFRYLDTGEPLEYKIPPSIDEAVQLSVWLAETDNYKKKYPEYLDKSMIRVEE